MKLYTIILLGVSFLMFNLYAHPQVAINTDGSPADNSAMLDVSSETAGVLIPRLSKAQRDAITIPATGLLIFQTNNTPGFYYYDGASWSLIGTEAFAIDDLSDGKTVGYSVYLGKNAGANDDSTNNQNVGLGRAALRSNTSGFYNSAVGNSALLSNTVGNVNTAVGRNAMYSNTTGNFNAAIGSGAGYFNAGGSYNTLIGNQAGRGSILHNKSGNVFLGYQAGYNDTTDNKLYIENSDASTPLIWGDFANDTVRINGTFDVNNAFHFPLSDGNSGQILQTDGSGVLSWNNDGGATQIDELTDGKTGGNSVFLGSGAGLFDDGTNNENTAIGYYALSSNTSGYYNTANGTESLAYNITGHFNTANGTQALFSNTTGHNNIAIGYRADYYNREGDDNTIIGTAAGGYGNFGIHNKFGNVILGYKAGWSATNGSDYNVFIGHQAGFSETGSNKLYIENSGSSLPLIYGEFDNDILAVNGSLGVGTSSPSTKFEVNGNAKADTMFADAYSSNSPLLLQTNGTTRIYVDEATGNVGVGTETPTELLEVADTIYSTIGGYKFPDGSVQISAAFNGDITSVVAGTGLSGGGVSGDITLNHEDLSSQESVNNSGGMVIQDISLETLGHVTSITSNNLDTRYFILNGSNTQSPGSVIFTDGIYAHDGDDLLLSDNNGIGITIEDGGNVGLGTTNPNSTFHTTGSFATSITTVYANTTLDFTHNIVLCDLGTTYTITLPNASSVRGRQYTIKKIFEGITIINTNGGLIDDASSTGLYSGNKFITVVSDGTDWWIIGSN